MRQRNISEDFDQAINSLISALREAYDDDNLPLVAQLHREFNDTFRTYFNRRRLDRKAAERPQNSGSTREYPHERS